MKRRMYLYRLIIAVTVLLLPLVFLCLIFWKRSFTELETSNQKYYESMLENFAEVFNAKREDLKYHTTGLIVASKNADSVFWQANELFLDNSYWYKEAIEEISSLHFCREVSEWGIYFYERDRVITTNGAMKADDYLRIRQNIPQEAVQVWELFEQENFEAEREFLTITDSGGEFGVKLLLCNMVNLGKKQDKAMVFYVIDSVDLKDFLGTIHGERGINYYILDQNSDGAYMSLITDGSIVPEFPEKDIGTVSNADKGIWVMHDDILPLTYVVQVTGDSFRNSIISFYNETKLMLYFAMLLLFCSSSVMLYFVYKPVYLLTKELEYEGDSEFVAFRSELANRHAQISEQKILIIDLLINNLVMGLPISSEKLSHLGVSNKKQYYCVMLLEEYVLSVCDVEELTREIEKKFLCKLFITDWEGEKESVLIVFMEKDNCKNIVDTLKVWLASNISVDSKLRVGTVVHSLDEIKLSYMSCDNDKGESATKNDVITQQEKQERQQKRREKIMEYIDVHYCDADLSQTQIADVFQISVYTLSKIFKNQIGVSFTDYVNGKRIEYSKELLSTTEHAIKDISLKVGYVNVNYFCKMFKSVVGVSPGEYRKQK